MNKVMMLMSGICLLTGVNAKADSSALSQLRSHAVLEVFMSNLGQMKISNPDELGSLPVKGKTAAEIFANASLMKAYPAVPNTYPATQYEINCDESTRKGDAIDCSVATYTETYQVNSHDSDEAKKVYQGNGESAEGIIPVIYTFRVIENSFRGQKAFRLFSNAVSITTAG